MGQPYLGRPPPRMTIVEPNDNHRPASELLGLSQACRQTHAESGFMLFTLNEFGGNYHHRSTSAFDGVENRFTVEQRSAISTMWITTCHPQCFEIRFPLGKFPGLQRVLVKATCSFILYETDYSYVSNLVDAAVGKKVDTSLASLSCSYSRGPVES